MKSRAAATGKDAVRTVSAADARIAKAKHSAGLPGGTPTAAREAVAAKLVRETTATTAAAKKKTKKKKKKTKAGDGNADETKDSPAKPFARNGQDGDEDGDEDDGEDEDEDDIDALFNSSKLERQKQKEQQESTASTSGDAAAAAAQRKSQEKARLHDDDGFSDSRGVRAATRKRVDGLNVYVLEDLICSGGGDTPLCPFDCKCCY